MELVRLDKFLKTDVNSFENFAKLPYVHEDPEFVDHQRFSPGNKQLPYWLKIYTALIVHKLEAYLDVTIQPEHRHMTHEDWVVINEYNSCQHCGWHQDFYLDGRRDIDIWGDSPHLVVMRFVLTIGHDKVFSTRSVQKNCDGRLEKNHSRDLTRYELSDGDALIISEEFDQKHEHAVEKDVEPNNDGETRYTYMLTFGVTPADWLKCRDKVLLDGSSSE